VPVPVLSAVVADILNIVAVLKTGLAQTQSAHTPSIRFWLVRISIIVAIAPMEELVTRFTPVS